MVSISDHAVSPNPPAMPQTTNVRASMRIILSITRLSRPFGALRHSALTKLGLCKFCANSIPCVDSTIYF
jgi:hypothetical protein